MSQPESCLSFIDSTRQYGGQSAEAKQDDPLETPQPPIPCGQPANRIFLQPAQAKGPSLFGGAEPAALRSRTCAAGGSARCFLPRAWCEQRGQREEAQGQRIRND